MHLFRRNGDDIASTTGHDQFVLKSPMTVKRLVRLSDYVSIVYVGGEEIYL